MALLRVIDQQAHEYEYLAFMHFVVSGYADWSLLLSLLLAGLFIINLVRLWLFLIAGAERNEWKEVVGYVITSDADFGHSVEVVLDESFLKSYFNQSAYYAYMP